MKKEFIVERQGKSFVLYAGLLDLAHSSGLKSMRTDLVQAPTEANNRVAICATTVVFEQDGQERTFTGLGDAAPNNVAPAMQTCLIRMAETRSKARALRDAVNVGVTAFEELEGEGGSRRTAPGRARTRETVKPRTDGLTVAQARTGFHAGLKQLGLDNEPKPAVAHDLLGRSTDWSDGDWLALYDAVQARIAAGGAANTRPLADAAAAEPEPVPAQPPRAFESMAEACEWMQDKAETIYGYTGKVGCLREALLGRRPEKWTRELVAEAYHVSEERWAAAVRHCNLPEDPPAIVLPPQQAVPVAGNPVTAHVAVAVAEEPDTKSLDPIAAYVARCAEFGFDTDERRRAALRYLVGMEAVPADLAPALCERAAGLSDADWKVTVSLVKDDEVEAGRVAAAQADREAWCDAFEGFTRVMAGVPELGSVEDPENVRLALEQMLTKRVEGVKGVTIADLNAAAAEVPHWVARREKVRQIAEKADALAAERDPDREARADALGALNDNAEFMRLLALEEATGTAQGVAIRLVCLDLLGIDRNDLSAPAKIDTPLLQRAYDALVDRLNGADDEPDPFAIEDP